MCRAGCLVLAVAFIAVGVTLTPPAQAAAADAAAPTGCESVDELSGYVPLYELNVPRAAYWQGGAGVPYTVNRSAGLDNKPSTSYLDRVAYCLDTVTAAGGHEWAYASFDTFTNDPRRLGVPSTTIAQRVTGLTTWGSNVKHVERADGGYIEFWPGTYRATASPSVPTGDSSAYDFSDTPRGSATGYGSMQVHNAADRETVLALNGWSHSRGRYLDIGTGNQKTGHPDWTFSQSGRGLSAATLKVYVKPAAPNATRCEQTVGELADYQLLYDAEVPQTAAAWADGVPYAVDNSASLRAPFSRVAYCLDGMYGPTPAWAYASMNAWTQDPKALGVPMSATVRRQVTDLTVRGSAVRPSDHSTGYLELWPNRYGPGLPPSAPSGGSATKWDIVDTPHPATGQIPGAGGYGSFQVHDLTHRQTVLAVNGWAHTSQTRVSAGVGTAPVGQPDWTFAENAGRWTAPHLRVYVKPAGVDIVTGPTDAQLYPRDRATNTATVTVRSHVTDPDVTALRMDVRRGDALVSTQRVPAEEWSTMSAPITAERAAYTVEVWAQRPSGQTLVRRATDVVAGDVYVIEGQSNAVAAGAGHSGTASSVDHSPWVRTFGYDSADPARSVLDRSWYVASGEGFEGSHTSVRGAIGQLGMRLGRDLADRTGVPVAILNGADGGKPSTFFQRSDRAPTDPATNYGRLLGRAVDGGLADAVRAVIWYQGEADTGQNGRPTAAQHNANVRSLLADWRTDFTGLEHVYVVQIRKHCGTFRSVAVQEVQRRLAAVAGVSVMTTMGLDGHDGCHYTYRSGYRQLGDWLSTAIQRDLYGARPTTPADPPNPLRAVWEDSAHTRIRIDLTDATQTLRCDAGSKADFALTGTTAKVAGVSCGTGRVNLTLTGRVTGPASLTYAGHPGRATTSATPTTAWIVNASGMGLLAFDRLPVS
ncbi:sialate O-acetylesterase [Streptomyces shenzhenensis]|uniref:sialate O-acetylesterase n=1 Tax=Streptomyces shenzhenensis TaxID=943815 RepID=UPI00382ED17C